MTCKTDRVQTETFNLGSLVSSVGGALNLGGTYEFRFSNDSGGSYTDWHTAAWYADPVNQAYLEGNHTHGLRVEYRLTNTAAQNKSIDGISITSTTSGGGGTGVLIGKNCPLIKGL